MQHQNCPVCGGLTVNVQGIEACSRCPWTALPAVQSWGRHPA